MSSAIKRLSTIIRPSNSAPPSPPKESGKSSIDAPAPAAPVDAASAAEAPKLDDTPIDITAEAAEDAVASPAPEQAAAPASTDDAQDSPSTSDAPKEKAAADAPKEKDAAAPATVESKKEGKTSHRRDPRDIGRSTIRRFSTILRSQAKDTQKDKEPVPPLPSQEAAPKTAEGEAKASEDQPPSEEAVAKDVATKEDATADAAPEEKTEKPEPAPETKNKTNTGKIGKRSSSFFTAARAAREGLQRTAKDVQTRARGPRTTKVKAAAKVEALPKIVKKGAAKGKRVVVITGATRGVGLQFVKQFAEQPNTFVIALSRTAEKSPALKPIVGASAKVGHNVRAIKLDVTSSRSIQSAVRDIVELTEGRIDLLINAAGSRANPALKVWDLQGGELEDELRVNFIGPVAFTNALLQYLKPMPPKEETKPEAQKEDKSEAKEDKLEDKAEAKAEEKVEAKEEKTEEKAEETKAEEKEEPKAEETIATETKPDAPAAAAESSAQTTEATPDKPEASTTEAPAETPAETPAEVVPAEGEPTEPAPEEAPSVFPTQPFVIFMAPSDPIMNDEGAVPAGQSFAQSPRTLFSLSRAALQVAIAKYSGGLASKGVGIVGVERYGLHDPHVIVSDEHSVAGVVKALPDFSVRDNGKLLKTGL